MGANERYSGDRKILTTDCADNTDSHRDIPTEANGANGEGDGGTALGITARFRMSSVDFSRSKQSST
jgi:hypothetical protein